MSIINTTQVVPSVKERIINTNTQAYQHLKMSFQNAFGLLNNTPDVQAVLDDFGTDAVSLFKASAKTVELLKTIDPEYTPPTSTNTYTFHPNGTVTLNVSEEIKE